MRWKYSPFLTHWSRSAAVEIRAFYDWQSIIFPLCFKILTISLKLFSYRTTFTIFEFHYLVVFQRIKPSCPQKDILTWVLGWVLYENFFRLGMYSALDHRVVFGTFSFAKYSRVIGFDGCFFGFGQDGWLVVFIVLRHWGEVHVTNFDDGLFLKNVFINNGLMVIFFGEKFMIPRSIFGVTFLALNGYHEVFTLS